MSSCSENWKQLSNGNRSLKLGNSYFFLMVSGIGVCCLFVWGFFLPFFGPSKVFKLPFFMYKGTC